MNAQDERIRDHLLAALDAELGDRLEPARALARRREGALGVDHRRRRWLPLAAAAVVLAIAAVTLTLVHHSSSTPVTPASASGVRVTCTATTPATDAGRDRQQLEARASALAGGVTVAIEGGRAVVSVPGATPHDVDGLCASATLQLRPLVAPVVVVDPATAAATDAPLPASEKEYDRLSRTDQRGLSQVLRGTDCAQSATSSQRPVIACIADADPPTAALLGPAVVGPDGISSAAAVAPSATTGALDWIVEVRLDRPAATAWAAYTTEHNSGGASANTPESCGATGTPCADYVAFDVDGEIVSLPVTLGPIAGGTVQLSGGFTATTARDLALALGNPPLPVPLRVLAVDTYS